MSNGTSQIDRELEDEIDEEKIITPSPTTAAADNVDDAVLATANRTNTTTANSTTTSNSLLGKRVSIKAKQLEQLILTNNITVRKATSRLLNIVLHSTS